jgi:hypothetical protein
VYHLYVVRAQNRDELQQHFQENGVSTGLHYPIPVHLQSAYAHLGFRKGDFPHSELASKQILSLPMYPHLAAHHQTTLLTRSWNFTNHVPFRLERFRDKSMPGRSLTKILPIFTMAVRSTVRESPGGSPSAHNSLNPLLHVRI